MVELAPEAGGSCRHCGLPLRREAPAEARFCCSGCYLAHHLGARSTAGEPDRLLARILLCALLSVGVMVFSLSLYGEDVVDTGSHGDPTKDAILGLFRLGAFALSAPVMLLLGAPLLDSVVRLKRYLSSDALVLFATSAAWLVSAWNSLVADGRDARIYFDSATLVLVLFHLGRWLDARARERARDRLGATLRAHPARARCLRDGQEVEVPVEELAPGTRVRLRPGEQVPADGRVLEGRSSMDTASLTGEEVPRVAVRGAQVHAGTRLLDGTLVVEVTAAPGASVRDGIERMFEEALRERAPIARLSDRAAGALLPVVLVLAAGTILWQWSAGPERALLNAGCIVLIACPCALGIATPLAFWVAIGTAWRRGVLVRGGEALERLARARSVFLDKTGTLTDRTPELHAVTPLAELSRDEALGVAAALEQGSEHPLARSVRAACGAPPPHRVEDFELLPGRGVRALVDGAPWRLVRGEGGEHGAGESVSVLHRGEQPVLELRFRPRLRPEAGSVVRALARRGLAPRVLTGDGRGPAEALARELGVPVEAELLPDAKAERVAAAARHPTVFVGDGLNDAVALATADVGIALPGGIEELSEAARIHLLGPDLERLPELHHLARRTLRVARANLVWAFGYNAIGIALAIDGALTPVFAASGMVLSSALVVFNASRLARGSEEAAGAGRPAGGTAPGVRPTPSSSGVGEARSAAPGEEVAPDLPLGS